MSRPRATTSTARSTRGSQTPRRAPAPHGPAAGRLGGVREAVAVDASPERLVPVSATFHGRGVFAPVAAALACGAALADVGVRLDAAALVELALPVAAPGEGGLAAHVIHG